MTGSQITAKYDQNNRQILDNDLAITGDTIDINASLNINISYQGKILNCKNPNIDITVPAGMSIEFYVIKNGTTRIIGGAGVTINGVLTPVLTITSDMAAVLPLPTKDTYKSIGV